MNVAQTIRQIQAERAAMRAFTLMEMLTAVVLLVLIIVGVGVVFSSAGRAVSVSQVTMEMMSNVRAVQHQIERDVQAIDRDGFIVIRSRQQAGTTNRFDMVTFLARGAFPNRTGTTATQPFSDRTVANAARVWYGQLVVEASPNQTAAVALDAAPTGTADKEYLFGRHTTLLLAEDGGTAGEFVSGGATLRGYTSINLGASAIDPGNSEPAAHISASRICIATITPGQLMRSIMEAVGSRNTGTARYEADNFCYRFKTVRSPYDGQPSGNLVNGYLRMHPQFLQGVPSFAVDWSDGTTDAGGNLLFYGLGAAKSDSAIEPPPTTGTTGDDYTAIFSYDTASKWPRALRFRYRVTDPDDRLQGGREFTQIVRLPQ